MLHINITFNEQIRKNYLNGNIEKYPNHTEIYILHRHTSSSKKKTQRQLQK